MPLPPDFGTIAVTRPEDLPATLFATIMAANRLVAANAVRKASGQRLTPTQFKVLNCLANAPGASLTEIATLLGVSLPSASVMLVKLAADGYVVRNRDPKSRRQMQIFLTERGQAAVRSVRDALFDQLEAGLERLDQSDLVALKLAMPALERLFSKASPG
jgi:DNA-binding MarR family transcriptional regulator